MDSKLPSHWPASSRGSARRVRRVTPIPTGPVARRRMEPEQQARPCSASSKASTSAKSTTGAGGGGPVDCSMQADMCGECCNTQHADGVMDIQPLIFVPVLRRVLHVVQRRDVHVSDAADDDGSCDAAQGDPACMSCLSCSQNQGTAAATPARRDSARTRTRPATTTPSAARSLSASTSAAAEVAVPRRLARRCAFARRRVRRDARIAVRPHVNVGKSPRHFFEWASASL